MFGLTTQPSLAGPAGAFGPFLGADAQLSDAEIRHALLTNGESVGLAHYPIVLQEVECWRGYVRADYLCVSEAALAVIEIKSDLDSLRRFDEQIRVYSAIADHVTLVVGWRLAANALRGAPWWWGVVLAERDAKSDVRFVPLRDGTRNPSLNAGALLAMLPMTDVRRLARGVGVTSTRLRDRDLREVVTEQVPRSRLHAAVREWLARLSQQRAGLPS